ncbi:MAG: efflux transporter outer membrane subunit [Pirellulaceae bacterium]|nr:efflux transporter outer membrane subunit [Pirellulaceae bacterium]
MVRSTRIRSAVVALAAIVLVFSGCTGVREYLHNGFKVGPNLLVPDGPVADQWIDATDERVRQEPADLSLWWTVFQDPLLDELIAGAQVHNLTLREAGFRVLQARAQLGVARGNLFPQSQTFSGQYQRRGTPGGPDTPIVIEGEGIPTTPLTLRSENNFFANWGYGFNLAWEVDFWGRYRRAIISAEHSLEASSAGYEEVMVTLLADIASTYVQIRTLEMRLQFVHQNIAEQRKIAGIIRQLHELGDPRPERRFEQPRRYHVEQIESILAQTESAVPLLEMELRETYNRMCVLLGMPPRDLRLEFPPGRIPSAGTEIVVGIPADLLRRRPDVRRAEQLVAAQAEQIGIAETELYPSFVITGNLGYSAPEFQRMFTNQAFSAGVGPTFQWNILNYNRIRNNMRYQEAKFHELLVHYQQMVLLANAEVENGLVKFLKAQERAASLDRSVNHMQRAVAGIEAARELRGADSNQIAIITQTKVQQQDLQAQAHGAIALGLIQVYRALGGGWEIAWPNLAPPLIEMLPDAPPFAESSPPTTGSLPAPVD